MSDIAIPRECIYKRFEKQPGPCPRCGGRLRSHSATYLIGTRRAVEMTDSFVISGDMGWFCARCPTVIINPEEIDKFLQHKLPHWDIGTEFALMGIVDLDAVPEGKRDLPLGDDDNPIPLVEFTDISRDVTTKQPDRLSRFGSRQMPVPARGNDSFEERYEDVLQNIEFGIVQVYRDHPEMIDWQALDAVEAVLRKYQAEARGRQARLPALDPVAEEARDRVETMCEWRLGRRVPFMDEEGQQLEISPELISLDEIIACLKRIRKSIKYWNRQGGRQGYLTFVEPFVA